MENRVQTRSMTNGIIVPFVHHTYIFKDDRDFFAMFDNLTDEDCSKVKRLKFNRGVLLDKTLNYIIKRFSGLEELKFPGYVNIGPCGIGSLKNSMPNLAFYLGDHRF